MGGPYGYQSKTTQWIMKRNSPDIFEARFTCFGTDSNPTRNEASDPFSRYHVKNVCDSKRRRKKTNKHDILDNETNYKRERMKEREKENESEREN